MTTRTVKDIVSRALRKIGQESDYMEAPDEAYEKAFNILIDMFDDWRGRGWMIIQNNPLSLNDTLSSADPILCIANNLAVNAAPDFLTIASPDVKRKAGSQLQALRVRSKKLPTFDKPCTMPRGSGNNYLYYFIICDQDAVCTESGAVITTGE